MDKKILDFDTSSLRENQQEIVDCIGIENYYKLTKYFGGSALYIAHADTIDRQYRNEQIINDYNKGLSYQQLAIKYGLSEVWIRNIVEGKA